MLKRKRVLVALAVQDFQQSDLMKGVQSYLLTHPDLRAHFCLLNSGTRADVRPLRRMIGNFRPDGVLARVVWPRSDLRLDGDIPLVSMGDVLPPAYPSVIPDQEKAGMMVAEYLIGLGLDNFAYVAGPKASYNVQHRWKGFGGALSRAGHTVQVFGALTCSASVTTISDETLCAWVAQLPRPVGVHAVFLPLAVRVLWACQELGLRVPEDVAVVGGQDIPTLATSWNPAVSALEINIARMGHEALRLLDELMHGANPPTTPLLIPPASVVPRQSSDVRGMRDHEVANLRRLISERAHRPLVVKELLAHTPLSRRALERRFEKHLGHTLHDEIVLAHMERAKRLLRETPLPATQVAEQSGFANYAVFSVAFRKHTGMTALAYRQQAFTHATAL